MPVHAVSAYEEPLRSLILAKKWSQYTAALQLAGLMWDYSVLPTIPFEYIIAVPAHWTRTARRGYNQAEVIARELGRLSGKPLLNEALVRTRRTKFQAACATAERSKNVADAFQLCSEPEHIKGRTILIVDDLMTTGATLAHVARELLPAQPQALFGMVACRVL